MPSFWAGACKGDSTEPTGSSFSAFVSGLLPRPMFADDGEQDGDGGESDESSKEGEKPEDGDQAEEPEEEEEVWCGSDKQFVRAH